MNILNYKLPDFDLTKFNQVSIGKKKRWATATAVNFISEDKIIVANFLNKKIYLIKISNGIEIIDEINTLYYPDLMDYKEISNKTGLIMISERVDGESVGSVGVYSLKKDKLFYNKNIIFNEYNQIHGIRIVNENLFLFTETNKKRGIMTYDLTDEKITSSFNDFKFYPKDIFLFDDKILLVTSSTRPNQSNVPENPESKLYLFKFPEMKLIDSVSFVGQTDCISFENGEGLITLQGNNSLLHFRLTENKLSIINEFKSEKLSFPHGVGMKNKNICVTNYGFNDIVFLNLSNIL